MLQANSRINSEYNKKCARQKPYRHLGLHTRIHTAPLGGAFARGVVRHHRCRPTEKVPLNLIEVILAQGSMFSHGPTAFSGERDSMTGTADLPTFCMEQTDGKFNFF